MKAKKIKIPVNPKYIINKRSTSNKNPSKNYDIFNKTNTYKIIQNTSDIDTSRNETTIESSVEPMKRITIYKKNSIRAKNTINIKKNNSTIFQKYNKFNKNNNNSQILFRCASANAIFKKSSIKKNDYKPTKINKNTQDFYKKEILNNSMSYINKNRKSVEPKRISKNIFNRRAPSINEYNDKNKINQFINIEDLMLLEEIFQDIISSIAIKTNISNECFELINFYNHSSLYNKFENYFKDEISKNAVHLSILIMLFSIIIIYHYSFNKLILDKNYEYIKTIINLNYKSFLLICEYISTKISVKEADNIWVKNLKLMVKYNLKHIKSDNKEFKMFLSSLRINISNLDYNILEIKYYSFIIQKNINILVRNLINDEFQKEFNSMDKNISKLSGGEIINFFRKKIIRIINKNGSVYGNDASFYGGKNIVENIKVPYLNYKTDKKFTLILDLDETLISFKIIDNIKNKGMLRLRPGLYEFLLNIKKNYELIIFTSATKEYADPLIDSIEKKMKYFDFRLYRQHTIIWENEFVKDLGKIGRPMNKLIIVDNLPQNFRLQKENGIMIKPFWGEDVYDTVLYELGIILNKIANEFYDTRKGIIKYKNEILSKVSSCFSKCEKYE